MKKLTAQVRSIGSRLKSKALLAPAILAASVAGAKAQTETDLFTSAGTEVTGMVGDVKGLLALGIPLVIAFIVFRLVKKSSRQAAG